jgi:hypothetical protein
MKAMKTMKTLGWILLAAVVLVSCSRTPREQKPASDSGAGSPPNQMLAADTSDMRAWFKNLLRSLGPPRDALSATLRMESDNARADTIVARFRVRFSDAVDAVNSSLSERESFADWVQSDSTARTWAERNVAFYGCSLLASEGIVFVAGNSRDILRVAGDRITPAMTRFLMLRAKEEAEGFSEDAGLVISWDALSDRIVKWESFIAANPSFLLLPEAQSWYDVYLRVYLTGMDNARVFDFEKETLLPEVQASYERFVAEYPTSKSAAMVRGYLEVLEREGFKSTGAVEDYLKANDISSMLAVQPPVR